MKIEEDDLRAAVAISTTWAGVCRAMGRRIATGNQGHIKNRAIKAGIDFSHFLGAGHLKGKASPKRKPASEFLMKDGPQINSDRLKKKLIAEGIKEKKCEDCNLTEWLGEPIPIELDHVDGNHWNNQLENLRIRCPNCHALKTSKTRSGGDSGNSGRL